MIIIFGFIKFKKNDLKIIIQMFKSFLRMTDQRRYESNLINNALFRPLTRFNNIIYNLLLPTTQNINSNVKELETKDKIIHDLILKIADNESHYHIQLENKNNIINDLKTENKNINYIFNDSISINNNFINNLKKDLDNKNNIIDQQKLLLVNKNKDINDLKNKNDEINKCTICLNNTISHCCIPCGHTYCSHCINESNNCYICRGNIHNNIRIYL